MNYTGDLFEATVYSEGNVKIPCRDEISVLQSQIRTEAVKNQYTGIRLKTRRHGVKKVDILLSLISVGGDNSTPYLQYSLFTRLYTFCKC